MCYAVDRMEGNGGKYIYLYQNEVVRFMDKIRQKLLLIVVCLLITINGIANNSDTSKIPTLKLKNHKVKDLIENCIKKGYIENNDILLIGFIEQDNELYLNIILSRKNRDFLLQASSLFRIQKFIGYSKIFNHDCYVFGDKAKLFFTKKDSVQIPKYFDWLLSLNHMEWEDFFPQHFAKDSDGNLIKVEMFIQDRGIQYKYVKRRFIRCSRVLYRMEQRSMNRYSGSVPRYPSFPNGGTMFLSF